MCVRTVDIDVAIMVIVHYNNIKPNELWMVFGAGSHSRYIPVHELTVSLDSRMCSNLRVFHAFRGCDIVSSFALGGGGEARKQLGSHGSRTQKLRTHLKTSSSCKMGSMTKPCQP